MGSLNFHDPRRSIDDLLDGCALCRLCNKPEVRNSRCGVSVKEARKEWHPPKEVLNSANIEGRDRRGLVQLPNSIGLHGARGLKVQILKGTEEH